MDVLFSFQVRKEREPCVPAVPPGSAASLRFLWKDQS